jgi:hypothetical protein
MTVCIAAISTADGAIVAAADMMLAEETTSTDTNALKLQPACPSGHYIMAYAGSPTEAAAIRRAGSARAGGETLPEMIDAYEQAVRAVLKQKIEGELLSRYGLDRETFLKSRAQFGGREFSKRLDKLDEMELKTDVLIAGFDPSGDPHIFSVHDPGMHQHHDPVGFYAIGTGSPVADGVLCGTYNGWLSANDLTYRVCEAKFLSETSPFVGVNTCVYTLRHQRGPTRMIPQTVEKIRTIWKALRPPVPPEAIAIIHDEQKPFRLRTSASDER